ncbi:MAG: hypothetical protein HKN47_10015 [Pirellulaceae bacterium]|nr:hypothetical protein [Pirellulaceae bacterium]
MANFHGQHRHLLNFFQGSTSETDTAQFPRLFDYVTTLPRFRGEVELINPGRLPVTPVPAWPQLQGARAEFSNLLQAPFDFKYDNRRQGEINLNTVSQYPVWQGLMQGHLTNAEFGQIESTVSQASFAKFQATRRGYNPAPARPLISGSTVNSNDPGSLAPYNLGPGQLNGDVPTQFARPFRDVVDADVAPLIPGRGTPGSITNNLGRNGVQASTLRPDVNAAAVDQANPFFVRPGNGGAHQSRDRNAFMKYQTLMRMPNLVSKQSNVMTMRLTMGFFEVDASTLSLGKEYNEDIAQNKRYQMLYIVDRSKPVSFKPGENTNVRDAVIFQRMVE